MQKFFPIVLTTLAFIIYPFPARASDTICTAGTTAEVKSCLTKLKANTVSAIEITKQISCDSPSSCQFLISNTTQGTIYGTPGSSAGFVRKNTFSTPALQINASSNLTISNLTFNDDPTSPSCLWLSWGNDGDCQAQIKINGSTNIHLEQLRLLNSKYDGLVMIGASKNITLKDSTISNPYMRGAILHPSNIDTVLIEGNTFVDTGGAAIAFSGKNITIKNNSISHAQWDTPWHIGGGQINVHGAINAVITGNNIFRGISRANTPKEFVGGIEFSGNSSNITISQNSNVNNTGPAVYNDSTPNSVTLDNVKISNNRFSGNASLWGQTIYDLTHGQAHWTLSNNCLTEPCALPTPNATLSLSPNPCYLKLGETTCAATISWLANFAGNVQVKRGTSVIATGVKGTKVITKIQAQPETITLVDNGKVLASQQISAVTTNNPSLPKPGDFNSDGKVDLVDASIIIAKFGNPYTVVDYTIMLTNFGK